MTDSLAAIFLIKQALHTPERIRHRKHRVVLEEIVHMLLTRTHPLSIYKVRAHSVVAGNEAVDRLAKEAHTASAAIANEFHTARIPGIPNSRIRVTGLSDGSCIPYNEGVDIHCSPSSI